MSLNNMNATTSRVLAGILAVLTISVGLARGATVRRVGMDTLVARSDRIVYGRVVGSRAVWDSATQTIWTQTEVQVMDVAKGVAERTVTVSEPGGVIGDVGHLFPGVPSFRLNDEIVLFLHRAAGDRLRVTGMRQGVFAVIRDPASGQRIARPIEKQAEAVYEENAGPVPRAREFSEDCRLNDLLQSVRQRVR